MTDRPKPSLPKPGLGLRPTVETIKKVRIHSATLTEPGKGMGHIDSIDEKKIVHTPRSRAFKKLADPKKNDTQELLGEINSLTEALGKAEKDNFPEKKPSSKISIDKSLPIIAWYRSPDGEKTYPARNDEEIALFEDRGWTKTEKKQYEKTERLMDNPFKDNPSLLALQKKLGPIQDKSPKIVKGKKPVKRSPKPYRRNSQ